MILRTHRGGKVDDAMWSLIIRGSAPTRSTTTTPLATATEGESASHDDNAQSGAMDTSNSSSSSTGGGGYVWKSGRVVEVVKGPSSHSISMILMKESDGHDDDGDDDDDTKRHVDEGSEAPGLKRGEVVNDTSVPVVVIPPVSITSSSSSTTTTTSAGSKTLILTGPPLDCDYATLQAFWDGELMMIRSRSRFRDDCSHTGHYFFSSYK